ncbi:MAG: D-glycerate dehydrogenase [Candidatus Tagabacteria bacterium CG09_land_8_20_14_0_10_41_14]|uniref:D-glycerate dehydrogenase n=2 Tax=Candidatus Tagaibacteriota TaxID=1817918 RepID=A0A2H0WLC0_9BACT|nr:MAG: D-glycerate dehydrogenase [Candidatus Tagabacteria bacterium CG09_land_8_20_14_0_10_41_14]
MKVYVTRKIPEAGINKLKEAGHEVDINPEDRVLSKEELISALKQKEYDAVLCLLTDAIDKEVFEAAPRAKIFANYAVGYDNIDLSAAKEHGKIITNTPGVLTETVAEHTFALMISIARRIAEADKFTREGKYKGWSPMLLLGTDLSKKTLGVIGFGKIGSAVAFHGVKGFGMRVIYYDIKRDENFEHEYDAVFKETVEEVLKEADFVSIHVPLLDSTRHLINEERLKMMKPSAYLINTSRGPVVDEQALVEVLKNKKIKGAALDVFENEPKLAEGLAELDNVILTPHIASATEETRSKMSEMAAENIIAALSGETPPNLVI